MFIIELEKQKQKQNEQRKLLRWSLYIYSLTYLFVYLLIIFFFFFTACDCPKGDPFWVPPILSQQCKENGACYCPSYNSKAYTMTEKGCVESSKQITLQQLKCKFPNIIIIFHYSSAGCFYYTNYESLTDFNKFPSLFGVLQ